MGASRDALSLSVVIPTYNRAAEVTHLLSSLEAGGHDLEVIVVDDGSPNPQIFDPVKARFPAVRFIHCPARGGAGAARNRGARESTAQVLLFLDSDTELVSGSIAAVRECFAENPQIMVCSGGISTEPINAGFFPKYKALLEASWVPHHDADVTFVAGRCFAVRRSAFLEVGGFSTDYCGAGVEDFELGYRLRKRFERIRFLSRLKVKHQYPSLWQQAKLYYDRVIQWLELKSHEGGFDNVGTTPQEAFSTVVSALLPPALAVCAVTGHALPALLFLILVLAANAKFLAMCIGDQGVVFAGRALAAHCYLAWWICAGGAVALLRRRRHTDSS